ncbi:MAG: hypothetical protein CME67_05790 [Halobacteriovoraceae bacterium]|nr:hypothetical protein [Halobacteriovoraceae bacterium]|tara:strand:- start:97 stop:1242 length:1146 start_codon:yes stop_codon:yes gene_type:complete
MSKLTPKIYQFYLASNTIVPFVVSTVFFVTFLLTFEMFRILRLMSSDEVSISFVAGLMGDVAITLVPMAIPLSMFFSVIYSLGKLSGDSEYVALRAAGLEKFRILIPYALVSFLVALNVYYLGQELVPNAHTRVRTKVKIISSASLIQGIKGGQFFTAIPNITIFPSKMNDETLDLEDVFLHIYNPGQVLDKVIWANTGEILHDKNEATGIETFKLLLNNGNITSFSKGESDVEKILFQEYVLPISEKRFSYDPSTKEIMMDRKELKAFIDAGLEEAKKQNFDKKDFFNAKYEYWNRMNTPILCILLSFLGFGLGITGNRGKSKNPTGKALLFMIGYYVVFFSMVNVARSGSIPPWLAMIIPGVILFGFGIYYYRKLDWVS